MRQESRTATTVCLMLCYLGALAGCSRGANGQSSPDTQTVAPTKARILFLHHSTGECVWNGGVEAWFDRYNAGHGTRYEITEQNFPKSEPYGWNNYPYDYWNIWVRHAGNRPYQTEPTLEMLTPQYDVIVFKHCFPVSAIEADTGTADVASEDKRIENYKLQYAALKEKMRGFPKTRFILWTGAALVKSETDEASARRARAFFEWVRGTWDQRGDNIYLWDFRAIETDGGLYLRADYASGDSHPNEQLSRMAAPLLGQRIVDVIRGTGDTGSITGKSDGRTVAARPASPASAPAEPEPVATQPTAEPGPDAWVFDNAEKPELEKRLWGKGAGYAADAGGHVIRIRFAEGAEEDWGEYGRQRIVTTKRARSNYDIARYRYVALRLRTDRDMELVITLITKPDRPPLTDDSHFGFSAYVHPQPSTWQWIVLDLAKLELGVEGDQAYAAAGKPTRPQQLTCLRFVTRKRNEGAGVAVDDITFHCMLPESLADKVQAP